MALSDANARAGFPGVGFALPIDGLKGLVGQLLATGRVRRPALGVALAPKQVGGKAHSDGSMKRGCVSCPNPVHTPCSTPPTCNTPPPHTHTHSSLPITRPLDLPPSRPGSPPLTPWPPLLPSPPSLPPQVLAALGVEGVLVLEVPAGSPAAAAGLRPTSRDVFGDLVLGDIIVGLDTRPVGGARDLVAALDERKPGDKVRAESPWLWLCMQMVLKSGFSPFPTIHAPCCGARAHAGRQGERRVV